MELLNHIFPKTSCAVTTSSKPPAKSLFLDSSSSFQPPADTHAKRFATTLASKTRSSRIAHSLRAALVLPSNTQTPCFTPQSLSEYAYLPKALLHMRNSRATSSNDNEYKESFAFVMNSEIAANDLSPSKDYPEQILAKHYRSSNNPALQAKCLEAKQEYPCPPQFRDLNEKSQFIQFSSHHPSASHNPLASITPSSSHNLALQDLQTLLHKRHGHSGHKLCQYTHSNPSKPGATDQMPQTLSHPHYQLFQSYVLPSILFPSWRAVQKADDGSTDNTDFSLKLGSDQKNWGIDNRTQTSDYNLAYDLVKYRQSSSSSTFQSPNIIANRNIQPQSFQPQSFQQQSFQPQSFQPQNIQPQNIQSQNIQPQTFQPQTFQPQTFQPQTFQPQTFQPQTFQPQTFQSQTQIHNSFPIYRASQSYATGLVSPSSQDYHGPRLFPPQTPTIHIPPTIDVHQYSDLTTLINSNANIVLPPVESQFIDHKTCSVCGKRITRDMSRHLRTHQTISRFTCAFPKHQCRHKSGKFNRPYDFKKHLLNRHFKFDDPCIKRLHNLSDKLDHWGVCPCGSRFKGCDWLDSHVLVYDMSKRCPLLE